MSLRDPIDSSPVSYRFDWDTGTMLKTELDRSRRGRVADDTVVDVNVSDDGVLTIGGKTTRLVDADVFAALSSKCVSGTTFPRPLLNSTVFLRY